MASLQFRGGVYRLLFQYNGRGATSTVGPVSLTEARQWKSRTETLLMRIQQRILEVPRGVTMADFIR